MFREGYYLEVIKAKFLAATAVITIKEKTIDVKNKKIKTNKWMTLEDWSSLYDILERALLLQNSNNNSSSSSSEKKTRSTSSIEKKKFTRHLEITYTFEESENPSDRTCLPTIRVVVSSLVKKEKEKEKDKDKDKDKEKKRKKYKIDNSFTPDKKSKKSTSNNNNNNEDEDANKDKDRDKLNNARKKKTIDLTSNGRTYDAVVEKEGGEFKVEEYIPGYTPFTNRINKHDRHSKYNKDDDNKQSKIIETYVPSRKSTLEYLQQLQSCSKINSNEYVPSNIVSKDETMNMTGGTGMLGVNGSSALDVLYIPNSVPKSSEYNLLLSETYEPSSLSVGGTSTEKYTEGAEEYIPNSKTSCLKKKMIDEYQPDFIANKNNNNKIMKFDESYIPSSTKKIKELIKKKRKNNNYDSIPGKSSRKKNKIIMDNDEDQTEKVISLKEDVDSDKKNSSVGSQNDIINREM